MQISLSLLLVFFLSCGKDVKIDSSKLEEASKKSNSLTMNQSGALYRSTEGDTIETNGKTFKISAYSSHLALSYVSNFKIGTQVQIKYRGEIKNSEIILEMIETSE